ncbi:unnamed protein product [Cuscuta europaea]|uniref:Uncharacterized protein n=1 Tax=Cuscuta europaea TaxID=41803 RepID=A0A9P0YMM8_CUSEU|nr:unnamed protein product [Cuscuta europaea]
MDPGLNWLVKSNSRSHDIQVWPKSLKMSKSNEIYIMDNYSLWMLGFKMKLLRPGSGSVELMDRYRRCWRRELAGAGKDGASADRASRVGTEPMGYTMRVKYVFAGWELLQFILHLVLSQTNATAPAIPLDHQKLGV